MNPTTFRRLLSVTTVTASLLSAVPAHAWTLRSIEQMRENPPTLVRTGTTVTSNAPHPSRRALRAAVARRARRSSSLSRSSSFSSRSSSVSSVSGALDPDTDASLRGRFALLGTMSPILGSVKVFNNAEPLMVTSITVTLDTAVTSVDQLLVYDEHARLLGSAQLDSTVGNGRTYTLNLKTRNLVIPQREEYSFYVRAVLKNRTAGGVSAELLVVDSIAVAGNGFWSNRSYNQSLTDDFNTHQIARSVITSVTNVGAMNEPLLSGTDREIGKFRFAGVRGDGSADLRLTELHFTISQTGNVSLSNAEIIADGSSERSSCTISSSTITCPLSASFGSLASSPRTLTLFADVAIANTGNRASLQVSLNEPGTTTLGGSIEWNDGTTTFDWVGADAPVVRGTYYSY
ncbi:MAG: hypothetical protein AAB544_02105 [Patescibacteria group bacterium]